MAIRQRFGRFLFLAAGPLLVTYLLLLLGTTYIAQQNLHKAALNELSLNLEKRASALQYFHTERIADLSALAEDQALSTYFSNLALGMSMEYGLRASQLMLQRRFERLTMQKRIDTLPVYKRLLFLDTESQRLVDVGGGQDSPSWWSDSGFQTVNSPSHHIIQDNTLLHQILVFPYFYKEQRTGTIIAEINHQAVFDKLVHRQGTTDPAYVLLANERFLHNLTSGKDGINRLISEQRPWSYPNTQLTDLATYTKIQVPETPYILAALNPEERGDGYLVRSPWYLSSLVAIAMLVLLTVVLGYRTQSYNLVLKAKVDASKRHTRELYRQNRLLETEIEKRQEYEEKLAHQANYDPLTGLPNRNLAMDRLSQALALVARQKHKVVGMFIDLDRFKNVNDSLGHDAGDLLLKQAAKRLQESIRTSDTAARLGGDEFMVLLPDVQKAGAAEVVAHKIMQAFSHPFNIHGQEFNISASIGVAVGPDNGSDANTLMKSADLALYKAKEAGRETYRFYTNEMNRHAKKRQAIETQLIRAVEKNEFHLLFQPMISLSDNRIIGTEALIRWSNPNLGEVSPADFIPQAEESGLILEIGEWVMQQAIATIAGLGPSAANLRLAINISCRQLLKPEHFLNILERSLQAHDFPANRLELEITERLLLEDRKETLTLLHSLTEMGVRLAVDDFGTGYSSLSYLKKFPLDVLKIDQSFVRDVLVDRNDANLTKAIIAIAHELDMEAVGEGVETKEQAIFLNEATCNIAQGYLFGRPSDAATLLGLLQQNSGKIQIIPKLV